MEKSYGFLLHLVDFVFYEILVENNTNYLKNCSFKLLNLLSS